MTDWRCFVAVPIGEELRAALAGAVTGWRSAPGAEGLRWTDPAGWHATVAFLGRTDPARLPSLADALTEVAGGLPALTLATGGVGGFPSSRAARVVWYGIADPDGRLAALSAAVREAIGLATDQPLRPHLTLARARGRARVSVDLPTPAPAGMLQVDELVLYRSMLGDGPARYEPLATARLGVTVHV